MTNNQSLAALNFGRKCLAQAAFRFSSSLQTPLMVCELPWACLSVSPDLGMVCVVSLQTVRQLQKASIPARSADRGSRPPQSSSSLVASVCNQTNGTGLRVIPCRHPSLVRAMMQQPRGPSVLFLSYPLGKPPRAVSLHHVKSTAARAALPFFKLPCACGHRRPHDFLQGTHVAPSTPHTTVTPAFSLESRRIRSIICE
jgi:hypothetical protein